MLRALTRLFAPARTSTVPVAGSVQVGVATSALRTLSLRGYHQYPSLSRYLSRGDTKRSMATLANVAPVQKVDTT